MLDYAQYLTWSDWQPLNGCWTGGQIPQQPGLYRIRRVGYAGLDYIGQTGAGSMTLKKRLGMLRGVYSSEMPYRDPHTAGPALWALRHATCCEFEVSVVPITSETPWRKGLEALAVSLYRQEYGSSPTVNFGRMPAGYRMSSANNTKLSLAGKVMRGGRAEICDASHEAGIAPLGLLTQDPANPTWCGLSWSRWTPLDDATRQVSVGTRGLYRVRALGQPILLYIGQGAISKRLRSHQRKIGQPEHRQGPIFGKAGLLEYAWVVNEQWRSHHRLELENDLIASHLLVTGTLPSAQFLG